MRHRKHSHKLGVKKEHREAMVASLATALFTHGRIQTTLAKARALRPFAEKIITLAKRAHATEDAAKKLHFRRLAIARVRDKDAVKLLFDERVNEFVNRQGGYTRIYKLGTRVGDAAEIAIIELVAGDDQGYAKKSKAKPAAAKGKSKKAAKKAEEAPAAEAEEAAVATAEAPAEEPKAEEAPAAEAAAEEPKAEPEAKEEEPKKE